MNVAHEMHRIIMLARIDNIVTLYEGVLFLIELEGEGSECPAMECFVKH